MNDIRALQNRDLEALEDPELHLAVSWRWYVDGGWLGKVMRGTLRQTLGSGLDTPNS